jgi:hypothetical protein
MEKGPIAESVTPSKAREDKAKGTRTPTMVEDDGGGENAPERGQQRPWRE